MKKKALKINWERHCPPGFDVKLELSMFAGALIISCLWSLSYIASFLDAVHYLGEWERHIPYFYELLRKSFFCFPIALAFMLASVILNYAHYYSGSKSIYLMRRLPNRWELHRRSLELPILAAALTLISAAVLLFIYYGIYMLWINKHGYHLYANQLELLLKNWSVM